MLVWESTSSLIQETVFSLEKSLTPFQTQGCFFSSQEKGHVWSPLTWNASFLAKDAFSQILEGSFRPMAPSLEFQTASDQTSVAPSQLLDVASCRLRALLSSFSFLASLASLIRQELCPLMVDAGAGVLLASLTLVLLFEMVSDETEMKRAHSHVLAAGVVPLTEHRHSSKMN